MQLFIFFLFFHYMFRLHAAIFRWLFPLYTVLLHGSSNYLFSSSSSTTCFGFMQPSSGGCFPSIQFFSTEAAAGWQHHIGGNWHNRATTSGGDYSITTEDGRVRPKHVLIEFEK
jgi:hypothetical protein